MDDGISSQELPSPQSWSQRSLAIAELLLPYLHKQPSVAEFNQLRYELKNHYKGRSVTEQTVRTLLNKYRADGVAGLEGVQKLHWYSMRNILLRSFDLYGWVLSGLGCILFTIR